VEVKRGTDRWEIRYRADASQHVHNHEPSDGPVAHPRRGQETLQNENGSTMQLWQSVGLITSQTGTINPNREGRDGSMDGCTELILPGINPKLDEFFYAGGDFGGWGS
jgi:hypothetical protein